MPPIETFIPEPEITINGYPKPAITSFSTKEITVNTSEGQKNAKEITIVGKNFLIRAMEPRVVVNKKQLNFYRIGHDEASITGYIIPGFGEVERIIVDYGRQVRADWPPAADTPTDPGPITPQGPTASIKGLRLFLILLLIVLIVATVLIYMSGVGTIPIFGFMAFAIILNIVTIILAYK